MSVVAVQGLVVQTRCSHATAFYTLCWKLLNKVICIHNLYIPQFLNYVKKITLGGRLGATFLVFYLQISVSKP